MTFAIFNDHFFPTIPSPHVIAKKLELGIATLMDEKSKAKIATLNYGKVFKTQKSLDNQKAFPKMINQMQMMKNTNMKANPLLPCLLVIKELTRL